MSRAGSEEAEAADAEAHTGGRSETASWARVVIYGGAALAILLIGATVGLLLARAEVIDDRAAPAPTAVDVGFSQDMSVHHLQAVTMGNWVREHSDNARVRQVGFDIASAQEGQVGMMEGWLILWDEPRQSPGEPMGWMDGAHGAHGAASNGGGEAAAGAGQAPMPGMATTEELEEMRSLSGEELDVYFLQLMHRHHVGGIEMAEHAAEHANVDAVASLAQRMLDAQGSEITIMENMLAERDAEPLPFDG